MKVTGTVKFIGATEQKTPTFSTRDLWVETHEDYPQTLNIQFVNDKCSLLDSLQNGHNVTVSINLRGKPFQNEQGIWKLFNTISGWKIEPAQPQSAVDNYQQQQGYQQNPQQNQQPQNGGTQQGYQQNNNGYQQ